MLQNTELMRIFSLRVVKCQEVGEICIMGCFIIVTAFQVL